MLSVVCFLSSAPSARAQVYGELSYATVSKTMLRFGAFDLNQIDALDDYLKINHCAEYRNNYTNDFNLQRLRQALQKDLVKRMAGFPNAYYFKAPMRLDRYDFAGKVFKLSEKSQLHNINSFYLIGMRDPDICVKNEKLNALPVDVGAILDQPVTLEGLPITEAQAEELIKNMNATGNTERVVHARFSLLVTYAPPLAEVEKQMRYNMDAQLLTIEFFEDPEFTKPIWVFSRG